MDITSKAPAAPALRVRAADYAVGGLRFDLAAALLSGWVIAGLFIDGWAHNNLPGLMESFFTPWHAVLYSGYLAVGIFHFYHLARNVSRGHAFARALPRGYWLSLIGVMIFGFGGGFDMFWHTTFGFEENIQALLSPAHMVLATGATLFMAGPLRAAWRRPAAETAPGWRGLLPAMLSLFQLLALLTFFTQYVHFLTQPETLIFPPARDAFFRDLYGVTGILLPAAILTGAALFALRRWQLPPGALTLLWGGNSALMVVISFGDTERYPWLLAAVIAGAMLADVLLRVLRPGPQRLGAVRAFAFLAPFGLFLLYFVALINTEGTWWVIHMWLGVPVQAGFTGLFLSLLAFPPLAGE